MLNKPNKKLHLTHLPFEMKKGTELFFLTVTFLGEQADHVVRAEVSKTRNQQVMFMPPPLD